jgi:ribosomal protein L7/L12
MIEDHMLPYIGSSDLKALSASIDDFIEDAKDWDERWRNEFDTPGEGLTLKEKMMVQGTRTPENVRGTKHKIQAIKSIRSRLDYGLKQAKELVDAYAEDVRTGVVDVIPAEIATWERESDNPEDCLLASERRDICSGLEPWVNDPNIEDKSLQVIKAIRDRNNWTLQDAKDLVDAYKRGVATEQCEAKPPRSLLTNDETIVLTDDFVE